MKSSFEERPGTTDSRSLAEPGPKVRARQTLSNTTYEVKIVRISKSARGVSVLFAIDPEADLSDIYCADGDTTFYLVKGNR